MRVKELADLAGTTVRTVRYYHQIGLLPIPERREGFRDYDLAHVARLIRIRWLVQAGVPLSRVGGMLHPDGDPEREPAVTDRASVLADLNATVVALEEQLEQVQARYEQVKRLITAVERHDDLSPLPAVIARFYARAESRAGDERVRRTVRRERDFVELAFYRGEMPPEVEAVYQGFDEARWAESVEVFGRVTERYESQGEMSQEEIEQTAAAVVERFVRHAGDELPRLARSVDLDIVRRAADLFVALSEKRHRGLDRAMADALVAAIEEARSR